MGNSGKKHQGMVVKGFGQIVVTVAAVEERDEIRQRVLAGEYIGKVRPALHMPSIQDQFPFAKMRQA